MLTAGSNRTAAQDAYDKAAKAFADPALHRAVTAAAQDARGFLFARQDQYDVSGGLALGEPFLSDAELALLDDARVSRFRRAENYRVAVNRVFANGLNHALMVLIDQGHLRRSALMDHHAMVFDDATLGFLGLLQRRHEAASEADGPAAQVTLTEAIMTFYSSPCKSSRTRVRDKILVPLAELGLVSARYFVGDGYALRAGPVLTQTIKHAVEPWFVAHRF